MSKRTLMILLLILIVAAGAAMVATRTGRPPPSESEVVPGRRLLPDLDVNAVQNATFSAGTESAVLQRRGDKWVLATLFDYPADYGKLVEAIRGIAELTVGQTVRDGVDYLEEFGLADKENGKPPLVVALGDGSGNELARLNLGLSRDEAAGEGSGRGEERYLRLGEGPVILVKENLRELSPRSSDWIDRRLLEVPFRDVQEVLVSSPAGAYTLKVTGDNTYEMTGLKEADQINPGSASRLARALQLLRCQTVADPATADSEGGFDKPSTYTAKTKAGYMYTVSIGAQARENGDRYIRLEVDYQKPPPPTRESVAAALPPEPEASPSEQTEIAPSPGATPVDRMEEAYQKELMEHEARVAENEKQAAELEDKLKGWTYLVNKYTGETLTIPRDQMLKKEAPKEEKEEAERSS